ncbi:MAG: GNAT family protein, partial [Antricoccus sp.]
VQLRAGDYRLEPLQRDHVERLHALLDHAMWRGMTTEYPSDVTALWEQLEPAIKAPDVMAFVALNGARVVGSTRFYDIAPQQCRLEIGSTFYARSEWGSALNPACKLMLMEHAFETMQMHRVALRCDSRNTRSAGAISRLGATAEGVLRGHRIDGTGTISDTAYFSVLQPEWSVVKSGLQRRLAS